MLMTIGTDRMVFVRDATNALMLHAIAAAKLARKKSPALVAW